MSFIEGFARVANATAATLVGLGTTSIIDVNITVPVFGVSVVVIGAAATGAATSLAFGEPLETRRKMFQQVFASTIFGATASVLLSKGFKLEWAQELPGAFALVTAAAARLFFPTIYQRVKELISKFELPKFGGVFKQKPSESKGKDDEQIKGGDV